MFIIIMLVDKIESFAPISSISSSNHHNIMLMSQIDEHNQSISRRDIHMLNKNSEHNNNNIEIYDHQRYDIKHETMSRRDMLIKNVIFLSSISSITSARPHISFAKDKSIGSSSENPVAILGGGGKTGKEVAKALAGGGMYGISMTRSGKEVQLPKPTKEYVQCYPDPVDVREADSILKAMQNVHASAIVYTASASSKGGTAFEVDDDGVANAARVAESLGIRFVLVSALGIDRPESKGYQMTNTLGGNYNGIMDAKRQGEEKGRKEMTKSKNYIIIRPGPLISVKSKNGAADIELNQGDYIGGGISRDELAGVVIGALKTDKRGVTVEAYRKATRQKIQPQFEDRAGFVSDNGYDGLFDNVKSD